MRFIDRGCQQQRNQPQDITSGKTEGREDFLLERLLLVRVENTTPQNYPKTGPIAPPHFILVILYIFS